MARLYLGQNVFDRARQDFSIVLSREMWSYHFLEAGFSSVSGTCYYGSEENGQASCYYDNE